MSTLKSQLRGSLATFAFGLRFNPEPLLIPLSSKGRAFQRVCAYVRYVCELCICVVCGVCVCVCHVLCVCCTCGVCFMYMVCV